jgi:hypothetical protein
MNSQARAATATVLATLVGLFPGPAEAAERGCPGTSIAPDAAFLARFPELTSLIRSQLAARADVDECARVELGLEGESRIHVSVMLRDGRVASRSVMRAEDVMPSLEALLLVPEPPKSSEQSPRPAPVLPRSAPARIAPEVGHRDTLPDAPPPRPWGAELSLISGARVGDGQFGVGAGVLSFLEVRRWLIGFEGRFDAYRPLAGGDPESVLELGILAGRRFDWGTAALDLTVGPAVALKGIAASQTEQAQAVMPPESAEPLPKDRSLGPAPRLLLGARLGFRPRAVFRPFVGVDGEIGPARGALDAGPHTARLPGYVLGLALGATVGTP